MAVAKEWNCMGWTWLVLLIALIVRLFLCNNFLLFPNEANYWQLSRYLDIGYHGDPPMIAWCIWLSTKILGQNEFAVRVPTILGYTIASVYMVLLTGRWFSWRCALHLVILSQGILLLNALALIATPVGILLPCWAASCYHGGRALERGSTAQWLLTGFWFGLGMLSKYTMLLFIPSFLIYSLLYSQQRKHLFTIGPWISITLGIFVSLPVIIWNSNNRWAIFSNIFNMEGVKTRSFLSQNYIADFIGTQAALLSPFVLIMIIIAWTSSYKHKRLRYDDAKYLIWTSIITFLAFLFYSFYSRVDFSWPTPGYTTALILIASLYSPGRISYKSNSKSTFWKITVLLAYSITIPLMIQIVYPVLPIPIQFDIPTRETTGWRELGQKVHEVLRKTADPENAFIFGSSDQEVNEMAFYMPKQPEVVSIDRLKGHYAYDYRFDKAILTGKDAVGVFSTKKYYHQLDTLFSSTEQPIEYKIYRHSPWQGDELVRTVYICVGHGFKGDLVSQTPEKDDIKTKVK